MGEARDVMDHVTEAFVGGHFDAIGNLYTVDAVLHTPDLGEIKGRDAIGAYYRDFWNAFPDGKYHLVDAHESGDSAIDEGYFSGTHTGPLQTPAGDTIPATGKPVRLRMCDAATVRGGRITSHRFYYDQMALLSALGLLDEQPG